MNRIQLLEEKSRQSRKPLTPRNPRHLESSVAAMPAASRPFRHNFFVPLHYEKNYAYPLLVWLHGPEDNHQQLKQVMPHVSVRNYIGVAPSSPGDSTELVWPQRGDGISRAFDHVEQSIQHACERFHVAPHRIFIAGYDRGGTMAMRLAMAAPQRFAGAASFGGPFPEGHQPMANLHQARSLPLMIAHGRDSEVYPIERVCQELKLFHVAGMSLNLRQYPCEQELTTQMLGDLDVWMMQIVTGVDQTASTSANESIDN